MATLPSQSTLVSVYNIVVTFNPANGGGFTFSPPMPADKRLHIGQGISFIVFDLVTPGEAQAVWMPDPISWLEGTTPPFNQPQRFNDKRFTLLVYNTVLEAVDNEHLFNLSVMYNGVVHTSDPTIINDPPGTG